MTNLDIYIFGTMTNNNSTGGLLVSQGSSRLPERLSSPLIFSGVRVTRSLVLYVCFVDRCLSFCTFSLVIVSSVLLRYTDSWYLKTLLNSIYYINKVQQILYMAYVPYSQGLLSLLCKPYFSKQKEARIT